MRRMDPSPMTHPEWIPPLEPVMVWVENGKVNRSIQLDGLDDYLAIQGLHYSKLGEIRLQFLLDQNDTGKRRIHF